MNELEYIKENEKIIYDNLLPYLDSDFIDLINSNSERIYLIFSSNIHLFCIKCSLSPKELFFNENISNETLQRLNDACSNSLIYEDILSYKLYEVFSLCRDAKMFVVDFLDIYKEDYDIISQINLTDINQVECLNLYLRTKRIINHYNVNHMKNNTFNDIINIKKQITKYLKELVNLTSSSDLYKIKEYITKLLFDIDEETFFMALENIKKIDKNNPLPKQLMQKINIIADLENVKNNKKSYCRYLNQISNCYLIFEETYNLIKDICKNEIVKSISPIIKENNYYNFMGEDFNFLIHAFSSLNRYDEDICLLEKQIISNPEIWTSNETIGSIISGSLINNYSFCNASNGKLFLGFNKIYPDDILDMGSTDILSNKEMYMDGTTNPLSEFLLPDEFIKKTSLYNEIVLQRYKNRKPLLPNYILTLDDVSNDSKQLSNYFNIPIYNINTEKYLIKMIEHLNYLLEHNIYDFILYSCLMINSFKFNGASEIISKYIDGNYMRKSLAKLLNKTSQIENTNLKKEIIRETTYLIISYNELYIRCDLKDCKFNYYDAIRELDKIKKRVINNSKQGRENVIIGLTSQFNIIANQKNDVNINLHINYKF